METWVSWKSLSGIDAVNDILPFCEPELLRLPIEIPQPVELPPVEPPPVEPMPIPVQEEVEVVLNERVQPEIIPEPVPDIDPIPEASDSPEQELEYPQTREFPLLEITAFFVVLGMVAAIALLLMRLR